MRTMSRTIQVITEQTMKPDRIDSLTGLRAVAMLTVFCSHLSYLAETPYQGFYALIDNGKFGVNFFLVLSGFVLALGYSDKVNANDFCQDVQFVKKRLKKIYIPYLITLILAIPLYIFDAVLIEGALNVPLMISRLIINIGMIQSAIPFIKYSTSINVVSWFISTIYIIYLLTPGILRLNNKASKHYTLLKLVILMFTVLFLYCCFYMAIREIEYVRFADRGLSIIYINPLIRLFPFLLGIIGYDIYRLSGEFQIGKESVAEISGMAVFFIWWIASNKTGLPTVLTECTDMLVSLLVVLIFAFSRSGFVSGLLSKDKMMNLGKISLEFYLVHYLVINYVMIAANHFGLDRGIAVIPLTLVFFALSLCGARLIRSFTEWLLSGFKVGKKQTNYLR